MRGQPFPVAGALDDDLVAGVGQPVQGAVAQDGVVEEVSETKLCRAHPRRGRKLRERSLAD